jgi:hypothetical protein
VVLLHQLLDVSQHQHPATALRASSAITRLLPALVGSTTTAGSGCLRKWLMTALTASV